MKSGGESSDRIEVTDTNSDATDANDASDDSGNQPKLRIRLADDMAVDDDDTSPSDI